MRPRRRFATPRKIAATAAVATACAAVAIQAGAATPFQDDEKPPSQGLVTGKAAAGTKAGAERPAGLAPIADFNKDGYGDYAVSAPHSSVGGKGSAGSVVVVFGSADGPDTANRQIVHLDSPGVPGKATEKDKFGYRTTARDFNGDGYTDLVATTSNYYEPSREFVTVLWGGEDGLSGGARIKDTRYNLDSLTAGDFNGDGKDDLVTVGGAVKIFYGPLADDGTASETEELDNTYADELHATAGDMTGDGKDDLVVTTITELSASPSGFWKGGEKGLTETSKELDAGLAGTVGDVDNDGYGDLVMRLVPGGDDGDLIEYDEGTVKVFYGSPEGPSTTETTTVDQDSPSIPGAGEEKDQFGFDLTAGDANGDGFADIGVSVPFESVTVDGRDHKKAGAAMLLPGGKRGTFGSGVQYVTQDSAHVPGKLEAGDQFGRSLTLRDLDKDGLDDLAAGAPGENDGAGASWVFRGTPGGLGADGIVSFGPDDIDAQGGNLGYWSAE